jgi:hypothetical protein
VERVGSAGFERQLADADPQVRRVTQPVGQRRLPHAQGFAQRRVARCFDNRDLQRRTGGIAVVRHAEVAEAEEDRVGPVAAGPGEGLGHPLLAAAGVPDAVDVVNVRPVLPLRQRRRRQVGHEVVRRRLRLDVLHATRHER